MASRRSPKGPRPVDAIKHRDKRVNIPTEELREFVRAEEESPKTLLYPRDPSLDPQLVWKGKDEQDREPLEVPVVPVYIQEKIHPQALIENLRDTAKEGEREPELALFDDFNGVKEFRQKIDFYSHDLGNQPKWANRMILGDSLLVMTSLAEKEGLKGKVQMIYVDPPYGIKFGSNWQVSTRKRDVKDGKVEDATRQPEQIKAFRDTWELGIHSYLAYLRDRFVVARDLLTETGSILVQMGVENVHLVRSVLDEVFGSENALTTILMRKSGWAEAEVLPQVHDFILWYSKDRERLKYRQLYSDKRIEDAGDVSGAWAEDEATSRARPLASEEREDARRIPAGWRLFFHDNLTSTGPSATSSSSFDYEGRMYWPGVGQRTDRHWKTVPDGLKRLARAGRLLRVGDSLRQRRYFGDFAASPLSDHWDDTAVSGFAEQKVYIVQTNVKAVERCLLMTTDPGDLVLDPTCGSGTTAVVAEQWGRRWITIDTSRVALALARTRLMSAKYPYYLLTDSPEGRQREAEITGSTAVLSSSTRAEGDIKKGFVYRRVPHVTLKSIANNEEIDVIHARHEEKLGPLREKLIGLLKQTWQEWEVPREADGSWPDEAKKYHAEWWKLRRERQEEIDDSIKRRADTELLFNDPYEDAKRIRVTGPFTVESLSPHRVLSADEDHPSSEIPGRDEVVGGTTPAQFETMILENLRKAGVQNTRRGERLVWQRLEPFAGAWIQAAGEYADAAGKRRRVAVSIGPEHGTVGQRQIQEAAKEALKGVGFDLLLVLGFAFDAHASEVAKEISPKHLKPQDGFVAEWQEEYGRLPVLLVRMNPDLSMGEDLLKKTGAGNLFMVFGEPDMEIRTAEDGKIVVEIRGMDVYDPTTGVIRSSTTDDIACWFLDTNYDEESFFVRHAYFTGAGDPYEKLKRALRAEVDEVAWASLYSTVSRPFDPPETGKIAVKVINHYGDEVLKVFEVSGAGTSASAARTDA
jgi:adenine-specific DNA-methyltransferase